MSVCAPQSDDAAVPAIVIEENPQDCSAGSLPPEGNGKLRNYLVTDSLGTYTIGDRSNKGKLVSKFDVWSSISQPRAKILELLRPEDPCKEALEAIVRPASRRGLTRPYDEDTRRFLQRVLLNPSLSTIDLSQTENLESESQFSLTEREKAKNLETQRKITVHASKQERSLADELKEAEEDERSGANIRRELLREFRKRGGSIREAMERDRLGKLALSVEDDEIYEECGLTAAARRLDALLVESRNLHEELAGIHEDMQVLARRLARRDH